MKKWLLFVPFGLVVLLGINWAVEFNTQKQVDQLTTEIRRIAPIGRSRGEVERAFETRALEHVFGPSDNAIYGRKSVGRYRLIYSTELIYKIHLDEQGRVMRLETNVFNEGL